MQAKSLANILLAALMLASCKAWVSPEESGAEFRSLSRDMYSSLLMPSCDNLKGFDRRDYLTGEASAIGNFEAQARTTPAWGHLVVAREDARYEAIRDEHCWSDADRSWAQRHVKMTKDKVLTTLPQLTALIPLLGELHIEGEGDSAKMAEFRYLVREMLTDVTPQCRLTESASVSDKEVLRPASDAVAHLKKELADTRFSVHFAIAEGDVAYRKSRTLVECAPPSTADPKQVSLEIATETARQIAALRATVIVGRSGAS
ncbi:MAG: hypothetical protein ACKOVA_16965 [Novosphingobium sp.]